MINSFNGEYKFLSNFYDSWVIGVDGSNYPTVEHAYQAAKTSDLLSIHEIRHARTPAEAKRLGRLAPLKSDWEEIKIKVMGFLLMQKFQDGILQDQLIETGNQNLIEGNTWGDTFWGVCNGVGENHLGRLLMKVRYKIVNGRL